jgi:hypothetical protein
LSSLLNSLAEKPFLGASRKSDPLRIPVSSVGSVMLPILVGTD